ncbi:MAG: CbtB domain-containing protein [Alphaproteobacteria bacterium]
MTISTSTHFTSTHSTSTMQISIPAAGLSKAGARVPAIAAMVLGAVLLFGTVFAQPNALHAATHDVRHAFAMPCH